MKLIHLSDLHLGKRLLEYSLIEEQEHILARILGIVNEEKPDGVIIAGDVYDKSVPSAEAMRLLDDFLYELSKRELSVFVISGNHDSPDRIAFGSRLIGKSGINLSPVYNGKIEPITLCDEFGAVNFYMLPFVKPANVRRFFEDKEIVTYTDAVRAALEQPSIDESARNVLVTHQFVTGATRCDSEEISVGGTDNVDASVFASFDYVALGHIHSAQTISRDTLRYCGTPLKYSFSEAKQKKSICIVELFEKGNIEIRLRELIPLRDMLELKGTYLELSSKGYYSQIDTQSLLHITLTDEHDIPDAIAKLRVIYPNLLKLDYDNARTRAQSSIDIDETVESKTPQALFEQFYVKQNGESMSQEQSEIISALIESIWEVEA